MADPTFGTVESTFVTEVEKFSTVAKAEFSPPIGNSNYPYVECIWGSSLASDLRNSVTDDMLPLTLLVYGKKRADVTNAQDDLATFWDSMGTGTKYTNMIATGGILLGRYKGRTPPMPAGQGDLMLGVVEYEIVLRYSAT